MEKTSDSFGVLERYLDPLYKQAGDLVEEEEDQISLTRFSHLLNDDVAGIIEKVLAENPLPFPLQDFQKIALHAIGSLKNVILVSPTGSGKMIVNYLAILVLQKVMGKPAGVGVGCQPLSSIMAEKLKTKYISCGTVSMKGDLKAGENEEDASLSASIEEFKSGSISVIIGHAESWVTPTAVEVLDSLQQKELILFSFLDEAHIPLSSHWDSFRPQMKSVPGMLRGRAVIGSPCLATTATLTPDEVNELQKCLGLRSTNTVVLEANPIQKHHKYVR